MKAMNKNASMFVPLLGLRERERLRLDVSSVNFPQSVKVVEMFLDVFLFPWTFLCWVAGEDGLDSGLVLDDDLWGHENSIVFPYIYNVTYRRVVLNFSWKSWRIILLDYFPG